MFRYVEVRSDISICDIEDLRWCHGWFDGWFDDLMDLRYLRQKCQKMMERSVERSRHEPWGLAKQNLLGELSTVLVELRGSLALTGIGHGTNKAIRSDPEIKTGSTGSTDRFCRFFRFSEPENCGKEWKRINGVFILLFLFDSEIVRVATFYVRRVSWACTVWHLRRSTRPKPEEQWKHNKQIEIEKSNKKVIEKTDQKTGENKYEKTKRNNSDFGLQNYES